MRTVKPCDLRIGWAQADITPDQPVLLAGQFHARVSEGVKDPVTATALALESGPAGGRNEQALLVSCDLVSIPDCLRDAVRERVHARLPDFDPDCVCLNATHTHTAPVVRTTHGPTNPLRGAPRQLGVPPEELGVMDPAAYNDFAADHIASAIVNAWNGRAPGGIAYGLGHAVVGRNRRISYRDGSAKMYGKTALPEFSHIEGYEDHDVNLLATYDTRNNLTGLIVNVACPSQVSEHLYQVSADYWHDTRVELRRRLGDNLFVLPQCGTGGDQSPHVLVNKAAEAHMLALKGMTPPKTTITDNNLGDPDALRAEIAQRIAGTVTTTLPFMAREIVFTPRLERRTKTVELTRNNLTEADAREALAEAAEFEKQYEKLRADLDAHPEKKKEPRWYTEITKTAGRASWFRNVGTRFDTQRRQPRAPVELTMLRLGDVAIATNPFEFYLDFGIRIKARSPAVQTFVVQLAGTGTYLPTERAVAGKSYGAVPASNPIGPAGGHELVEHTLQTLQTMWNEAG